MPWNDTSNIRLLSTMVAEASASGYKPNWEDVAQAYGDPDLTASAMRQHYNKHFKTAANVTPKKGAPATAGKKTPVEKKTPAEKKTPSKKRAAPAADIKDEEDVSVADGGEWSAASDRKKTKIELDDREDTPPLFKDDLF